MDSDVRVNVLPLAHACELVSAMEPRKLPPDDASHREMCDSVSLVPPLVHAVGEAEMDLEPDDAADHDNDCRVVDPAAALLAPDAPGSPVCNFTYTVVMPVNVVAPRTSSHLLAMFVVEIPTVIPNPVLPAPAR
jgi:hypothetical protein